MAAMLGFLGTPTFDFVLTLRVLNRVVLVLLNSGFHHLQKNIDGSDVCCLCYSCVSKLIFITIYKVQVTGGVFKLTFVGVYKVQVKSTRVKLINIFKWWH